MAETRNSSRSRAAASGPDAGRPPILVREGSGADTDRILELVRLSLGEGVIPRDLEYWSWKHHRNPFGESPVLLAEAEGRLVGLRVFMRWEWRSGAQVLRAVRAVDTATHPDWQGRGIFSNLTLALVERMRDDGVAFVFNTPNDRSRPGYLKMGWRAVGRIDLWIRPLRPVRIARAALFRARHPEAEAPARPESGEPTLGKLLAPGSPLEQRIAAAATSAPSDTRLTVSRGPAYLRWRYLDVPGFRYDGAAQVEGDSWALVIHRTKAQGALSELRICELLCGPDERSRRIATRILSRLRRSAAADYISAMAASGSPERRLLIRGGFLPAPRLGPILTVLPLSTGEIPIDPLDRRNWRASLGDLELF